MRPFLLEVDAHHQLELIGELGAQAGELLAVIQGRVDIVDRAGADDDQQATIIAAQDGANGVPRARHQVGTGFVEREGAFDGGGGQQGTGLGDMQIIGLAHGWVS